MQDQLIDLYRNGMKTAAHLTRVSLENTVRLQEKQLDIARKVLDESSRSAERVSGAKNMDELLAAQTELAGSQMQRIAEFWTTVWQAAAENQKHLIEQAAGNFTTLYSAATRSAEDVARTAASQVSRAAGSVRESAAAANHGKGSEGHRKSA
jgi:Phasin protein